MTTPFEHDAVPDQDDNFDLDVFGLGTNAIWPFLPDLWGTLEPLADVLKHASGAAEVDESDVVSPITSNDFDEVL